MADVWLINGVPGAGKSTVARALSLALPRAAHVEGDALQAMILAGGVPPGGVPEDEERRQIHLCVRNQCLLARSFADHGITPVIDYVVTSRDRVREYQSQLPGHTLRLVTLDPGEACALDRDRERPGKTVARRWIHLAKEIRRELAGVGLRVDNSKMTVDQTVAEILDRAPEAIVPTPAEQVAQPRPPVMTRRESTDAR